MTNQQVVQVLMYLLAQTLEECDDIPDDIRAELTAKAEGYLATMPGEVCQSDLVAAIALVDTNTL